MKYRELEVGKSYRWEKTRGSEFGKIVRSAHAGLSLSPRAVRNQWRQAPDDGIVTLVTKKWYAVVAKTAAGEFISIPDVTRLKELEERSR